MDAERREQSDPKVLSHSANVESRLSSEYWRFDTSHSATQVAAVSPTVKGMVTSMRVPWPGAE